MAVAVNESRKKIKVSYSEDLCTFWIEFIEMVVKDSYHSLNVYAKKKSKYPVITSLIEGTKQRGMEFDYRWCKYYKSVVENSPILSCMPYAFIL